jgi:hypothetical protein
MQLQPFRPIKQLRGNGYWK